MTSHAVVIAGAGPTGLMLAAELALAGIDVAIVERRETQDFIGSRALGLHARSLELLDQRGVVDRFLAQGKTYPVAGFAMTQLPLADLPSRHNYTLGIPQQRTERILAAWVGELNVPIVRGCDVAGFAQDEDGVEVSLSDGRTMRAQYLVGCDGGRSVVRKLAGIEFPGWEPSSAYLIAEAAMSGEPVLGVSLQEKGMRGIGRLEDGVRVRIVLEQPWAGQREDPTVDELRAALVDAYVSDFGVHDVSWLSRFTDAVRQAAAYRDRRVLLAGDAAHVHSPVGGQGLDTGLGDAVNLGWKLALAVRGPRDALLDSYHAERHPVAARVLRTTMAQTALRRGDARTKVAHEYFVELLKLDEPRRRYAAMVTGLDVHYDLGAGHPLLGRRAPDVDVETAEGPRRLSSFLHRARPLLITFGGPLAGAIEARCTATWELPVLGAVPAPAALLVRPDGHVAWVGDGSDHGLADALATWC